MNTDKIYAEQLANEYAPKNDSKVIALRKLDARAKLPATIFTYTFGIISALITGIGMCLSMGVVNFAYMLFRFVTAIQYRSVWFFSMAVYYLVLCVMKAHLVFSYRCREQKGSIYEIRCYRRTAGMLFLLNIPMAGMIVLMIQTDSGFTYPGYLIYLSALYTFYMMILSIINLIKFRKMGSPIISAAKVLNFVSALMSVLGLQTAMISRFSFEGEAYRKMMNTITGTAVFTAVMVTVIVMLIRSSKSKKEVERDEKIRK